MTYTAATRDRYRLAVWASTATVAAGAITATGWLAGAAAHDQAELDAAQQSRQAQQDRQDARAAATYAAWLARSSDRGQTHPPRTTVRQRPTQTRVVTRYVTATSPSAAVGAGGTVSTPTAPAAQTQTQPQTSTPVGGNGNGNQSTSTPPPPPPPPPTPTNGS